jgi:calcium/calmodulin-dependent protein kinase I
MQAILQADYSFTPIEYWRNVSLAARDFIKQCLTIDPKQRMSAHQALQHPWINTEDPLSPEQARAGSPEDLLPTVKKNFNARRTLHKAIDTVRAINKLREGGGLMAGHMDGQMSVDPKPKTEEVHGSKVMDGQGAPVDGGAQGGGLNSHTHTDTAADVDAMEIDSRGNAHGQTQEQIERQQDKVRNAIEQQYQKMRGVR